MGEGKKNSSQWRGVHHLLTQGKSSEAQELLAGLTGATSVRSDEAAYLQAWCMVTQERWEDVAQQVREFPVLLDSEERESLLTSGSVRRRRPICLLMLGEMARKLGYLDEALEHIQHCLALLNERRMNISVVRLLAHCSLGSLALEMKQTSQALIQYETANALCTHEEPGSLLHAAILTGLCGTYIRLEQFEQALIVGKQALRSLQEGNSSTGYQEPLLLMLSRINLSLGDSASALAYAQDARRLAEETNDDARVALALLTLAEIQQKEHQMPEAQASCEQALVLLALTPDVPLNGTALFLSGKIAETEWRSHPEQESFAIEAEKRYKQALTLFTTLHDLSSLARVAKRLAQLLEDRGEPEQALIHWKNAYSFSEQGG